jgi:hypothetical protein
MGKPRALKCKVDRLLFGIRRGIGLTSVCPGKGSVELCSGQAIDEKPKRIAGREYGFAFQSEVTNAARGTEITNESQSENCKFWHMYH